MEMTNEIRAKIFALYLGAEVLDREGKIHTVRGVSGDCVEIGFCARSGRGEYLEFNECQLLLKPLSAISDEDAVEVVELMKSIDYGELDPLDVQEWLREVYGSNGCTTADYVSGHQLTALTDLLRSLGYALPYMGLDLFEHGIAGKL